MALRDYVRHTESQYRQFANGVANFLQPFVAPGVSDWFRSKLGGIYDEAMRTLDARIVLLITLSLDPQRSGVGAGGPRRVAGPG